MKTRELTSRCCPLCWLSRLSTAHRLRTRTMISTDLGCDYRDGEISLTFDQTPVPFALHAIHAKTGFQIVIPLHARTQGRQPQARSANRSSRRFAR